MGKIEALRFDNLQLRRLPVHADLSRPTEPKEQVSGACFSRAAPTPLDGPKLVAVSAEALALLDIDEAEASRPDFADLFCGNQLLPGSEPAAHCYCGHQFGHFSGQLGDGATMYLGEVLNHAGERWEVQFKGAGRTHYSRSADGRKVLRSSVREFLASEANHALGIPTTRAATLVTSDTRVARDPRYDGNVVQERASAVLRVAPSFLRFGSFEICRPTDPVTGRAGPSAGETALLEQLLDHAASLLCPDPPPAAGADRAGRWLAAVSETARRTARMVASWQCVGFCHGVLNTDNMSVLGLTIDYGPFGFMEAFDADYACNASDGGGRYTYRRQPEMCRWNVEKLLEALAPVLPLESSRRCLEHFDAAYGAAYAEGMRRKLGLATEEGGDADLVQGLLDTMQATAADFTATFRALGSVRVGGGEGEGTRSAVEAIVSHCLPPSRLGEAARRRAKQAAPQIPMAQLMQLLMVSQRDPAALAMLGDPAAVQAELSRELEKAQRFEQLLERAEALGATPAGEKRALDASRWTEWAQKYRARLGRDPSASSAEDEERREGRMAAVNPRVVLRNSLAQAAIDAAEAGDARTVARILRAVTRPFEHADDGLGAPRLDGATDICVS